MKESTSAESVITTSIISSHSKLGMEVNENSDPKSASKGSNPEFWLKVKVEKLFWSIFCSEKWG